MINRGPYFNSKKLLRRNGVIAIINGANGWEAGEITKNILPNVNYAEKQNKFMENTLGFKYEDVIVKTDYGTTENMIDTYGFIFGYKAINYIKENNISKIDWKLRVHFIEK